MSGISTQWDREPRSGPGLKLFRPKPKGFQGKESETPIKTCPFKYPISKYVQIIRIIRVICEICGLIKARTLPDHFLPSMEFLY
jgi:hypothetical protein